MPKHSAVPRNQEKGHSSSETEQHSAAHRKICCYIKIYPEGKMKRERERKGRAGTVLFSDSDSEVPVSCFLFFFKLFFYFLHWAFHWADQECPVPVPVPVVEGVETEERLWSVCRGMGMRMRRRRDLCVWYGIGLHFGSSRLKHFTLRYIWYAWIERKGMEWMFLAFHSVYFG